MSLEDRPFPEKRIIVICDDENYIDIDKGSIEPLRYLPIELADSRGGFICGRQLYAPIIEGTREFAKGASEWRMRIGVNRRRGVDRNGRLTILGVFQVNYLSYRKEGFTFSNGLVSGDTSIRWDILNLENFVDNRKFTLEQIIQSSLDILTLCSSRGVSFRGSRGSLSSLLLRASPYWKSADRRPAPRFINNLARERLPGNHYSVSDRVGVHPIPHCYYVDQSNAHHTIAGNIHIPHPGFIRARGHYFPALTREHYPKWLDTPPLGHSGLYLCRFQIFTIPRKFQHLYPKWVTSQKPGSRLCWVWSPEFRLFDNDHFVSLEHIICGFTATDHDLAITEYADWSTEYLSKLENKSYVKPTLLAAYGMLAFNSTGYKSYRYWHSNIKTRGREVDIPLAGPTKEVCVQLPDFVQVSTLNVCARGLIEAETRTRSLELARSLSAQGMHIPQVYADAILVETEQLPFLPDGWRISHSLTNVRIPRANAIVSDQLTKMPGMSTEEAQIRFRSRVPFMSAEDMVEVG